MQCTESNAAPIVDLTLGTLLTGEFAYVYAKAAPEGGFGSVKEQIPVLLVMSGIVATFVTSGLHGLNQTARCRDARKVEALCPQVPIQRPPAIAPVPDPDPPAPFRPTLPDGSPPSEGARPPED